MKKEKVTNRTMLQFKNSITGITLIALVITIVLNCSFVAMVVNLK